MEEYKKFTKEELAEFNGQDGKPTYVAYEGRVIDVSSSKRWIKGKHMNRHQSGEDLTSDLAAAPHDTSVLERFPQVGVLEADEEPEPDTRIPAFLRVALEAFPSLQRHPHPMTVHFPIVFMMFSAVFTFLYVTSGVKSFETTAFHMLGAGVLFTLVAMTTGFMTWWLNYMARPMKSVIIKIALSSLMWITALICFIWRIMDPGVLDNLSGVNLVYLLIILAFVPEVSIIGYLGAELTFPVEGKRK